MENSSKCRIGLLVIQTLHCMGTGQILKIQLTK